MQVQKLLHCSLVHTKAIPGLSVLMKCGLSLMEWSLDHDTAELYVQLAGQPGLIARFARLRARGASSNSDSADCEELRGKAEVQFRDVRLFGSGYRLSVGTRSRADT